MTFCPCQIWELPTSGGAACGGSAAVSDNRIEISGGLAGGGSASIWVCPDAWDGMAAVWPLNEEGSGEIGEFADRTRNNLHATGGSGVAELTPTQDFGLFCQPSQRFEKRQFINTPRDHISPDQAFTVSLWARIDTRFQEQTLFSRGVEAGGHSWNFQLGTSYLNHLLARLHVVGDETATTFAFSTGVLQLERWYHLAATWTPTDAIRLYINGVLAGSEITAEPQTVDYLSGNHGYIGRFNSGLGMTGNVQDVRLAPFAASDAWVKALHDNSCVAGFFEIGESSESIFG